MAEAYRVLKQDHLMVCFYGWTKIDRFFAAWHSAGFRPVGHLVFCKSYSTKARFMKYQHEQAYLLAKGNPPLPEHRISDVRELKYTGNALHPTQKAVMSLTPLIRAFTLPDDIVLDPFCGSASTCAAALLTGRIYIGIELDNTYYAAAAARLDRIHQRTAAKRYAGALAA